MENIITNEQINEAIFLNKKEKIEESLRTTYRKKIWKNFIKAIKEFDKSYSKKSICNIE